MRGSSKIIDQPAVVAAAAHELKSPLTLISYLAQTLGDQTLALTPAERLAYLDRLQTVSQRALRLVQQLTLSYRAQDQLAFTFNVEPVSAREVCENALHELAPYAAHYRQQLQLQFHRPYLVVANRDILQDVMVNLVDNAIRHNPPGGRVQIGARSFGSSLRLHVHDSGQPISRGELNRLSRTIGKSPQPLSGHAGSSGLGLYIAGQLAEAMGGRLGLGRARQGTTFFVDFKRSKQLSLW